MKRPVVDHVGTGRGRTRGCPGAVPGLSRVRPRYVPTPQQPQVVPKPVAGERLVRVVGVFATEKLAHLRMTAVDLHSRRPPVIRQVVAATQFSGAVDESTEIMLRLLDARG